MRLQIRYVKSSDGTRLAVATLGEGKPLVYLPSPPTPSIEGLWEIPDIRRNLERFAEKRTVVIFDGRGIGLSSRDVDDLSLSALERDIEAVLDGLGFLTVDLFGPPTAGPSAISFAAHHPDRVRKLVLIGTTSRPADVGAPPELRGTRRLMENNWELWLQTMSLVAYGWTEVGRHWAERLVSDGTKDIFLKSTEELANSDVSELLPLVRCPTLVMHWRDRGRIPIEVSQEMTSAISNARLVTFSQVGGVVLSCDWDSVLATAAAFLDEDFEPAEIQLPQGTAIILFADIVDSTALTEHLGDAAFRSKARDLDAALRTVIREHAGTPIEGKLLGDGVLAVFTSAREAIEAAVACANAGNDAGLPLHLGLHAGDVIREDNNVYGGAVNIAARISGLSAPSEVLVSDIVRGLARTSAGVAFEDRGEQSLKGVGEPVRVWAVREAE